MLRDLLDDGLIITIYDYDENSKDDNIGMALIDLEPLFCKREGTFSGHELSLQGYVSVKVIWQSAAGAWEQARTAALATARPGPIEAPALGTYGVLSVRLHSAEGLMAADRNGYSDPYVAGVVAVVKSSSSPSMVQLSYTAPKSLNVSAHCEP